MDGLYYQFSENKGADQLRGYREADLRLCFRIYAKSRVSHDAAQIPITPIHFTTFKQWFLVCKPRFSTDCAFGLTYTRAKYWDRTKFSKALVTSTHNLCFKAKRRKNIYPCKPQFYYTQRTNGPVNALLISGPSISIKHTKPGKNKVKK